MRRGLRASLWVSWLFAFRDLRLHRFRSLLTVLAIGVGVAAFVALGIVGKGVHISIRRELDRIISADLIVYSSGLYEVPEFVSEVIAGLPGVKAAAPVVVAPCYVENSYYCMLIGARAEDLRNFFKLRLISGRMFGNSEAGVIIIDQDVAAAIGVSIGSRIEVRPQVAERELSGVYTVIGISQAGVKLGGWAIFTYVIVPLRDAQRILGCEGYVSYVLIQLEDRSLASRVKDEISRLFPGAMITEQKELLGTVERILNIVAGLTISLTLVGLTISLFATANTIMTNVREHTRDIGILMALGARRWQVALTFMTEAFIMGVLGGLLGSALGYVGAYAVRWLVVRLGFCFNIPIVADPRSMLLGLLLAVLVAVGSALYPSLRAASIRPVEALRYE